MPASRIQHALFPTAIGTCAIAWSKRGLVALTLPERDDAETERRIVAKSQSGGAAAPPPVVAEAIELIQRYCAGERIDFSSIPLDLSEVDPVRRCIYETMRKLAFGETTTYGELARRSGAVRDGAEEWEAARDVGIAMGRNPLPIVVPCH